MSLSGKIIIRDLGEQPYETTLTKMRQWTEARVPATTDECWLLTHPPVFTLGQSAKTIKPHRNPDQIPVIASDRGGQITYHGPGQLILYMLLDLRRLSINVKQLVYRSEELVIQLLAEYGARAQRRPGRPGVYVDGRKIAALGYKIKRGYSYHGLSINHAMDLSPFGLIDICGYPELRATDMRTLGIDASAEELKQSLTALIPKIFYNDI